MVPIISCFSDIMLRDVGSETQLDSSCIAFEVITANTPPILAYWIAFGPHGPRALPPPGEGKLIFWYTAIAVGISGVIFFLIRSQARPAPGTMNQQYQEMTNEYLKVDNSTFPYYLNHTNLLLQNQKTEPISGVSSEGYTGKGQVQSKPKRP